MLDQKDHGDAFARIRVARSINVSLKAPVHSPPTTTPRHPFHVASPLSFLPAEKRAAETLNGLTFIWPKKSQPSVLRKDHRRGGATANVDATHVKGISSSFTCHLDGIPESTGQHGVRKSRDLRFFLGRCVEELCWFGPGFVDKSNIGLISAG